jgi:cell wall assembly regulator SMI1
MDTVNQAWRRIEHWLAEHAPATLASLNPPADPTQLAAAKAELGVSLPADLVASFACHDGVTHNWGDAWHALFKLPPSYRPVPVGELVEIWRGWVQLLATAPPEIHLAGLPPDVHFTAYRRSDWIPVATTGAGDELFVVAEPGDMFGWLGTAPHGGVVSYDDSERTMTALLQAVADSLEQGTPAARYLPVVNERGGLAWELDPAS